MNVKASQLGLEIFAIATSISYTDYITTTTPKVSRLRDLELQASTTLKTFHLLRATYYSISATIALSINLNVLFFQKYQ